jgi:hypothetical protein
MAKRSSLSLASLLLVVNLALSGAAHANQIEIGNDHGVDLTMAVRGDTAGDDLGSAVRGDTTPDDLGTA